MRKIIVWIAIVLVTMVAVSAAIKWQETAAVSAAADESARAKLVADVDQYRSELGSMGGADAARRWFELYDRATALSPKITAADYSDIDFDTGRTVDTSVFANLPTPSAWPALRAEADARAARKPKDPRTLGLQFLARLLDGDRMGAAAALDALERAGVERSQLNTARSLLARIYGSGEERVTALQAELAPTQHARWVEVPGLVALVGESRARAILEQAVQSDASITIQSDPSTRALARQVALQNIDRMRVAQWALAADFDGAPLFEALVKRFKEPNLTEQSAASDATLYYFLRMVSEARQAEAEHALKILTDAGEVSVPHAAVDALERANLREELYHFLHEQLQRRPELRAWDLYVEQAAYTGHAQDAIALIEKQLARSDLSAVVKRELQYRHAAGLLAVDDVAGAEREYLALFAKPPEQDDPEFLAHVESAIDAAGAGRLTQRKALQVAGVGFARAAFALHPGAAGHYDYLRAEEGLSVEMRRQGRAAEAAELVAARLARAEQEAAKQEKGRFFSLGEMGRTDVVELASLQLELGKPAEVVRLLAESKAWGGEDLAEVIEEKDSLGVPIGAIAARALSETGDKVAALRVARATVAAAPGHDAAYEIVITLDPDAEKLLDERFGYDSFEERPLIWKAQVQLDAGRLSDAEATIRRAIAIDPSDGEEGPNDRMRAYAVLAEILKRRGATSESALYAGAVQAIRMSERTDELHRVGLYERAFAGYRAALEKFADAYCIQSRLAVQLNRRGRREEALVHYRRAYELMPASFGRVESHCFGCESVFQGKQAQSIAEGVFNDIISRSPQNAQAHYLLAYLREQQGRYDEALQPLRAAVSIDDRYLNAWKRLQDLAGNTYIEPGELDIARLKLLELDPMQRHSYYSLEEVGQLAALWNTANRAHAMAVKAAPPAYGVYPLAASARVFDAYFDQMSPQVREHMKNVGHVNPYQPPQSIEPGAVLAEHALVATALQLMSFPGGS